MKFSLNEYFIDKSTCFRVVLFCALQLLSETCQLFVPWLLGMVIDGIVADVAPIGIFVWLLLVAFVSLVFEQLSTVVNIKTAYSWKQHLRMRLLDAWCLQEPDEAEGWQQGEAGMKFMRDIPILGDTLQTGLTQLTKSIFMFLLTLTIAFWKCWQIGGIIVLGIPVMLKIYCFFYGKFQHFAHQSRLLQDEGCSRIFEFFNSYPELKAQAAIQHYQSNVSMQLTKISGIEYANFSNHVAFQRCFGILLTIFEYATLGIACYLACRGRIPVGQIIFFQVAIMRVLNACVNVLQFFPHLVAIREARDSLLTLLKYFPEEKSQDEEQLIGAINRIELEHITYAYPGSKRKILDNYGLCVKQGECIALEGDNGIGKTTLWKLLAGWIRPSEGEILINGLPLERIKTDYRRRISFVTQRTLLFYGSLLENITLGRPELEKEKMDYVLRMSGFDNVLRRFSEGLNKHIENNAGLSGGECQRLAIARALYRQPEILILDEVTNHMDTSGKAIVKKLINEMRGRLIIIVISHEADIRAMCNREYILK